MCVFHVCLGGVGVHRQQKRVSNVQLQEVMSHCLAFWKLNSGPLDNQKYSYLLSQAYA